MKKVFLRVCLVSIIAALICISNTNSLRAADKSDAEIKNSILEVVNKLEVASNSHDIEAVANFYGNNYVSGDNLNKKQVIDMIKDTWDAYPDIRYSSDIKSVRYSDNWGAVETYDSSQATTAKPSEITEDKGALSSESHSVIYLRRVGKDWKIVSDCTYYEKAVVKYGSAKSLEIDLSAPEQVAAGETFSVKVVTEVPVGSFAVGSITQEPIIYPIIKSLEKFRTIDQNIGSIERVFQANETNNNELVTATIGVTELTEDNQARPTVKLKGIYVIGNRINVVPASTFDVEEYKKVNMKKLDSKSNDADVEKDMTEPDVEPIEENDQ